MKKILILALITIGFANCSNEFELTENWKDITIVYGLLNQADTAQYIRIERAFLDPETSALTIAQIADSLYYDNITVELQAFVQNGSGGSIYQLERVDANLEGFQRTDGVFATSPNYVYKLNAPISENFNYRLIIRKNDGEEITAETKICEDFNLSVPSSTISSLRFRYNTDTPFRWSPKPNSVFYSLTLRIFYKEAPLSDPTNFTTKSLDWVLENFARRSDNGSVNVLTDGAEFYKFLENNLEEGFVRDFEKIDVIIGAGAQDLLNYIEFGNVANSTIAGNEVLQTYTNLSEGYGLFSSRFLKTFPNYGLDGISLDSLRNGIYTRELGF